MNELKEMYSRSKKHFEKMDSEDFKMHKPYVKVYWIDQDKVGSDYVDHFTGIDDPIWDKAEEKTFEHIGTALKFAEKQYAKESVEDCDVEIWVGLCDMDFEFGATYSTPRSHRLAVINAWIPEDPIIDKEIENLLEENTAYLRKGRNENILHQLWS
tara:strand:+ start:122 stop:589 length:468 start_codon:yes stop_codon:yes gene_type:complete